MLNTVTYDGPAGTPLLIAHGLFGSARNWGVIAKRLSATRKVIAVDMRNHADSDWHDSHSYLDLAADLAAAVGNAGGYPIMPFSWSSPATIDAELSDLRAKTGWGASG